MEKRRSSKLKIFTWHIHGTYLYYLAQGNYDLFIPIKDNREAGYYGKGETFPFGNNVYEVPADQVKNLEIDCILFQSKQNYLTDQYEILSAEQRALPKIYLEHDPPREVPTDTAHVVNDPNILLVHVTHFNRLMWHNQQTPVKVIDHGVVRPNAAYSGEMERGIVVVNNIEERGRRLGLDVFMELRKKVPLDLIGMGSEKLGLGEIPHRALPAFISRYRFFFNPIRYTSLGLSVLEAMIIGMPVVGVATTELVTVIQNGRSGYIHTDIDYLAERMKDLLDNPELARQLGATGQEMVADRFSISRFVAAWEQTFQQVTRKANARPKSNENG